MATFRLNDPETWLPSFARGNGLTPTKVRLHLKDGTREGVLLTPPNYELTTTDPRAIRHLENSPRYTRVA